MVTSNPLAICDLLNFPNGIFLVSVYSDVCMCNYSLIREVSWFQGLLIVYIQLGIVMHW